jgi:two-component system, chemotaxis family, protein-glutamate methylesterase/glutaminase
MRHKQYDIIVIGGSAGSIPVVTAILSGLPNEFRIPVVLVLHRQKNVISEMTRIFQGQTRKLKVTEPEDKEVIREHHIYLAPQNYHLLVEKEGTFSLDYSEPVHFSRPSIDVTFESISRIYANKTLGVLLSGANKDGTKGIETILSNKGKVLVQDPSTTDYPLMVSSAIEKCKKKVVVLTPAQIAEYIAKTANS